MRRIRLFLLSVSLLLPLSASEMPRHGAWFELGGSGIAPTFNYERRIGDRWYGRIGVSVIGGESDHDTDVTFVFPLTASWVGQPESNHHLELGGGITIATGDRQDLWGLESDDTFSTLIGTGIVGYRYQKPDGGFLFRATGVPVLGAGELLPWFGLTFGYSW